jgi:hypothetical protein
MASEARITSKNTIYDLERSDNARWDLRQIRRSISSRALRFERFHVERDTHIISLHYEGSAFRGRAKHCHGSVFLCTLSC